MKSHLNQPVLHTKMYDLLTLHSNQFIENFQYHISEYRLFQYRYIYLHIHHSTTVADEYLMEIDAR